MELKKSNVVFDKDTHTYTLYGKVLSGVTPIVGWLFPETYASIPESVMKSAAEYGSMIHAACQMSDVVGIAEHESVKAYQRIKQEYGLTTIANEFLVSDDAAIASSIDVVCKEKGANGDALIDIKTTSKVHENHLAVQLSIYAWLYEWQTGRKVGNLYCIWLPRERYGKPAIVPVQRIAMKDCQRIVKDYLSGDSNENCRLILAHEYNIPYGEIMQSADAIPAKYADVVAEIRSIEESLAAMQEKEKALKEGLLQLMRDAGVKKWQGDGLTLTYVAPSKRTSVDNKKLKDQYPEVYYNCIKESNVKDSIKVTLS